MKSSTTAQEVARLAQVSQSAVSRTFTPGGSVSEKTRSKVIAAANALGYRPNALARSLITRRSRIIALVMSYLENQFYPLVIERLSQKLQKQGYHVLLFISDLHEADSVLAEILQYQVDGVVMASTMLSSDLAKNCSDSGVPVVLFNRVADASALARVHHEFCDFQQLPSRTLGGRAIAEPRASTDRFPCRLGKFVNQCRSRKRLQRGAPGWSRLDLPRAVGHYSFEGAQKAMRELFVGADQPDAVFVANDHMAIAAMDVLRIELGLRIPEDVGVIGFDDVPQAAWGACQLTTVAQSVEAMVDATVDLLHEQMQGEVCPRKVVIPCCIVERQSVRPVPRQA